MENHRFDIYLTDTKFSFVICKRKTPPHCDGVLVTYRRLELRTPWLKVRCSTDWANKSNLFVLLSLQRWLLYHHFFVLSTPFLNFFIFLFKRKIKQKKSVYSALSPVSLMKKEKRLLRTLSHFLYWKDRRYFGNGWLFFQKTL